MLMHMIDTVTTNTLHFIIMINNRISHELVVSEMTTNYTIGYSVISGDQPFMVTSQVSS